MKRVKNLIMFSKCRWFLERTVGSWLRDVVLAAPAASRLIFHSVSLNSKPTKVFVMTLFASLHLQATSLDTVSTLSSKGRYSDALKVLEKLKESKKIETDLYHLTKARVYFSWDKLEDAVSEYSKVPKKSDLWSLSLEERAQSYGRLKEYDKAVSDLVSVEAPLFNTTRSPEFYFVKGVTHLKTCNFEKVAESLTDFQIAMDPQIKSLEKIAKGELGAEAMDALKALAKSEDPSITNYIKVANLLPTRLHRDQTLMKSLKSSPENVQNKSVVERLKVLATRSLKEISRTIDKMQAVKADLRQKLAYLEKAEEEGKDREVVGRIEASKDQLQFPHDGSYWIDEIGYFKTKMEGCPKEWKL